MDGKKEILFWISVFTSENIDEFYLRKRFQKIKFIAFIVLESFFIRKIIKEIHYFIVGSILKLVFEEEINMFSKKITLSVILVLASMVIAYSILFIFKGEKLIFWVKEDGFFETGGALMYLLASVVLLYLYVKSTSGNNFIFFKTKRNLFFLLLGFLFFFCFGEEISWGQRIFNIDTPEMIKEINAQKEINVHNLYLFHGLDENAVRKEGIERWYNLDRLFSVFWFVYCFIIPILDLSIKRISVFFRNLNIPIVPLWIGSLFLINYIFAKAIEKTNIFLDIHPIIEIKEANIGFLFFIIGLSFYSSFSKKYSLKTNG